MDNSIYKTFEFVIDVSIEQLECAIKEKVDVLGNLKGVWIFLLRHANKFGGSGTKEKYLSEVSSRMIQDTTGFSRNTIRKYLRLLEKGGFIRTVKKGGYKNGGNGIPVYQIYLFDSNDLFDFDDDGFGDDDEDEYDYEERI